MEKQDQSAKAPTQQPSTKKLSSNADMEEFLSTVDTFLLDCDGVLWTATTLIPKIKETLEMLRQKGKHLIFVTNNSTKSRTQYLQKFKDFGINASKEEVFSSSYAAAAYLHERKFKDKVYVVGEEGICKELEEVGIRWLGAEGDKESIKVGDVCKIPIDPEIKAVVVGFDGWINYKKIAIAQGALLFNEGCQLIATNTDHIFPGDRIIPGGGTMVAAVERCSGKTATVLGKPETVLMDLIVKDNHLDKSRTVMVGDRLDTDIAFGLSGGVRTLLVLSGIHTEKDAQDGNTKPHFIIPSFSHLLFPDLPANNQQK